MPAFTGRRTAGGLFLVLPVALFAACSKQPPPPPVAAVATDQPVSTEPGEVELSDPRATFEEPNLVRVEVRYRFTKGQPDKYYMVDVAFPGTKNHGTKPMMGSSMSSEGVIKDTFELFAGPATKFEIRMSEANAPRDGYKPISNVVSGPVK
jgi:hypothetical protein